MIGIADYNKGRTCPCKRRSFWKCSNNQVSCPEALWEAMVEHDVDPTGRLGSYIQQERQNY